MLTATTTTTVEFVIEELTDTIDATVVFELEMWGESVEGIVVDSATIRELIDNKFAPTRKATLDEIKLINAWLSKNYERVAERA